VTTEVEKKKRIFKREKEVVPEPQCSGAGGSGAGKGGICRKEEKMDCFAGAGGRDRETVRESKTRGRAGIGFGNLG